MTTVKMLFRKHFGVKATPVSIALSNLGLEKIDKEASKQKRSRSEYVELHFENIFFDKQELQT
jgi:hypothetical protein